MMKTNNFMRVSSDPVQNGKFQRVEYSKMFSLKTPTLGHHCKDFYKSKKFADYLANLSLAE